MRCNLYQLALIAICLCVNLPARATSADPVAASPNLESLKQDVLALNRDLLILEEELLFPSSTQVVVFLSLDVGTWFSLDAVKLEIDDQLVASELYTERQLSALVRGGIQRLYLGNLKSGSHEITAFFTGKGPQGRDFKTAATITVEKMAAPTLLELKIADSSAREQAEFSIVEWEL